MPALGWLACGTAQATQLVQPALKCCPSMHPLFTFSAPFPHSPGPYADHCRVLSPPVLSRACALHPVHRPRPDRRTHSHAAAAGRGGRQQRPAAAPQSLLHPGRLTNAIFIILLAFVLYLTVHRCPGLLLAVCRCPLPPRAVHCYLMPVGRGARGVQSGAPQSLLHTGVSRLAVQRRLVPGTLHAPKL